MYRQNKVAIPGGTAFLPFSFLQNKEKGIKIEHIADGYADLHAALVKVTDAVFKALVLTQVDAGKRCNLHLRHALHFPCLAQYFSNFLLAHSFHLRTDYSL